MSTPGRAASPARAIEVLRTERLSDTMVRLVFGGDDLTGFPGSEFTDGYVKLAIPVPGVAYPDPLVMGEVKQTLPQEQWPIVRTYTIRTWNAETRELVIDFVVHGDAGVAGPWAAKAQPGTRAYLQGPGGAYRPDPALPWHLFLGDSSALPAIAASLDALDADARGVALIEVETPGSVFDIAAPAGVTVLCFPTAGQVGDALVTAARTLDLPADFDAFVHGEAGFVKQLRTWLRAEVGLPKDRLSVSGYWRLGDTDEAWRASKAQWTAEAESAERAAATQ